MSSELANILDRLQRERFYGSLEIRYEAGQIVVMKKTESIKLKEDASASSFPSHRNNRKQNHVGNYPSQR
jgi:hypothetical protein